MKLVDKPGSVSLLLMW